jgi:hypothetical protein
VDERFDDFFYLRDYVLCVELDFEVIKDKLTVAPKVEMECFDLGYIAIPGY